MDRDVVSKRLRALAAGAAKRSKAARLRDIIDDVEAALSAGVPRADVVAELAAHGLDMSLATFETTLKRIRHAARNAPAPRVTTRYRPGQAPSTQGPMELVGHDDASSPASAAGSCDPADLDRIINDQPDLAALAKLAKRNRQ